jgi:hypothetical protein
MAIKTWSGNKSISPFPIYQKSDDVFRQVVGQQRHALPFGTGQVRSNPYQSVAGDLLIEEDSARAALPSTDFGSEHHPIVLNGEDIVRH